MSTVNFSSGYFENSAPQLMEKLGGYRVSKNEFRFDNQVGKGFIKRVEFGDFFEGVLQFANFNRPVSFTQEPVPGNDYYVVSMCAEGNIRHEKDREVSIFGAKAGNGAFFSNILIPNHYYFPENEDLFLITFRFNTRVGEGFIVKAGDELHKLIRSKNNFVIYEHLTYEMGILIDEIKKLDIDQPYEYLIIKGKCLELLGRFFGSFYRRQSISYRARIDERDIEILFSVRDRLIDDLSEPPQIEHLAREFGLSATKLKRQFKEVFGTTIYRYFNRKRMYRAKELLASGTHSATAAGLEVGYSNLSHFAASFKKEFDILPKDFLKKR